MAKTLNPVPYTQFIRFLAMEVGTAAFGWEEDLRTLQLDPKHLPSRKQLHKQVKRALKAAGWSTQGKQLFPCLEPEMNQNAAWYVQRHHYTDKRAVSTDMVCIECGGTAAEPVLVIYRS